MANTTFPIPNQNTVCADRKGALKFGQLFANFLPYSTLYVSEKKMHQIPPNIVREQVDDRFFLEVVDSERSWF